MAARGEFFRSYHLPVLSAEQKDSQSEEINVIDESRAKNKPMPVQEAERRGAYHLATKSGNFGLKSNSKVIFRKFRSEIVEYLQRLTIC